MDIRTWLHRPNKDEGKPPRAQIKRKTTARRRSKVKKHHSSAARDEQYNSDFITRYGDPFD